MSNQILNDFFGGSIPTDDNELCMGFIQAVAQGRCDVVAALAPLLLADYRCPSQDMCLASAIAYQQEDADMIACLNEHFGHVYEIHELLYNEIVGRWIH